MASATYTDFSGKILATTSGVIKEYAATVAGQTITGVAGLEQLKDVKGGDVLIGTTGDNSYQIVDSSTQIKEVANGGVDTVYAYTDYKLPDNIENLTESQQHSTAIGNSLGNILISNATDVRLDGGAGNDVLISNQGQTTFVFTPGSGKDVIVGFHAANSNHDTISVAGYGLNSFSDIQSHLTQQGADTLLKFSDTDAVLIRNTQVSSLTASDFSVPLNLAGMKMTFDDEFNSLSTYNTSTKTGTWTTNYQSGISAQSGINSFSSRTLSGNAEKEVYVNPDYQGLGTKALGLNPFSDNDGVLTITGSKTPTADLQALNGYKYTSGVLTTANSFSQQYGYFEMRAELPTTQGAWPAFWLLPKDGSWPPEIDVMESIGANKTYSTTHTAQTGAHEQTQFATTLTDVTNTYHTYGVLWTPQTLTYYVDGQAIGTQATPADLNKPAYLLLNLAIGGTWPGDPNADFTSAQYKIDYVRAYALADPTSASSGTATATAATATASTATAATVHPVVAPLVELIHTATSSTDHTLHSADAVNSAFSYTLAGTIAHKLTLTGSAALEAHANDLGDSIFGNAGADHLYGGAGADTLTAGSGLATLTGGAGDDFYVVNNPGDVVVEAPGGGTNVVLSTSSDFVQPANVQRLVLIGNANLQAHAGPTNGWLTGNNGNDTLIGGAGGDYIHGGLGADSIVGGAGNDTLQGGGGSDTFTFAPGSGRDYIVDFSKAEHDKIDVSAYVNSGHAVQYVETASGVFLTFKGLTDVIQVQNYHASQLTDLGHGIIG